MGVCDAKAGTDPRAGAGYTGTTVDAVIWEDREGTRWIQLHGELDTEEYRRIYARFHTAVEEAGAGVVIDLTRVHFVSSDGIRLLLEARNYQRAKGRPLHLSGLGPPVRKTLLTTGVLAAIPEWPGPGRS